MQLSIVFGILGCVVLARHKSIRHGAARRSWRLHCETSGRGTFKLVVTGHTFTSRGDIEKYLAYRAARHTVEQGGTWFTLNEDRGKGETTVPVPAREPEGPR